MKRLKIIGLSIVLLCFCLNSVNAQSQQKTVYEKKLDEITQKYFKIFYGYNKSLSAVEKMQLNMITDIEGMKEFILGIGILGYATEHSEAEVKRMTAQIENDLKQAEKLKTDIDFQREKARKAIVAQAAYAKTDAGDIQKNIKNAFETWSLKGEFEKQADYEERLQKQSQNVFTQICTEQIKNRINKGHNYYLSKKLQPYNADDELFIIEFKFNSIEWQSKLNIPIANAENFKNNWSNLRIEINDYNWCFIENTLCPTLITLFGHDNKSKYQLTLPLQNQSEIACAFDDMDIDNPYLKIFVFKYSDAKNTPVEEHREIAEVEDDADISPDSDSSESKSNDLLQDSTYVEIKQQAAKEAEEVDKEVEEVDEVIPFAIVEEKPRFQGKDASEFVKWIYGQLDGNYPQEAVKNNIQGKVYVSFTVNVDGTLSDIRSIRKTDPILEECIIGIVKKSPKWTPGRRQNKPVKVTYQVPIQFRL